MSLLFRAPSFSVPLSSPSIYLDGSALETANAVQGAGRPACERRGRRGGLKSTSTLVHCNALLPLLKLADVEIQLLPLQQVAVAPARLPRPRRDTRQNTPRHELIEELRCVLNLALLPRRQLPLHLVALPRGVSTLPLALGTQDRAIVRGVVRLERARINRDDSA